MYKNKIKINTLKIVLTYFIVATLWILFSDEFLSNISLDPLTITKLQTYKGLFFITVTAFVLYITIRNLLVKLDTEKIEQLNIKNALQQSEERYRLLIETSPYAIGIHQDEKLIFINDAGVKLLGAKEKSEIIGLPISKIIHPHNVESSSARIKKMLAGERDLYPVEDKYVKLDGNSVDVQVTAVALNYNGRLAVQVIVLDITEQIKTKQEILNRNKELTKLFEISLTLLESLDKKTILKNFVNDITTLMRLDSGAIYLLKENDLKLDVTFPELPINFPDEFRLAKLIHHPHILEAISTNSLVVINDVSKSDFSEEEKLIIRKRNLGSMVYLPLYVEKKVIGVLILSTIGRTYDYKEHELNICHTLSNLVSIALENSFLFERLNNNLTELQNLLVEKNNATKALKESEERWQFALEGSGDGVWDWNILTNEAFFSKKWKEMHGYEEDEIKNNLQEWENRLHPLDSKRVKEIVKKHLDGKTKEYEIEYRMLCKDGSYKWVLDRGKITSFTPDGKPSRMLGTHSDISIRKRNEDEIYNSREKLRALAARLESAKEEERINLARELHDNLGQSLTGLKMDISWLRKRINNEILENHKTWIEKTKSMSDLIDTIIGDVRRISHELRPNILDYLGLIPALEWYVEDFRKRTEIDCEIVLNVNDILLNKKTEISVYRILQEAFTNIIRHSAATRVLMIIDETEDYFIIILKDNGKGISEDEVENLHSLGLTGMKERTIQFDGVLIIEGEKNKGTTITLKIPTREKA